MMESDQSLPWMNTKSSVSTQVKLSKTSKKCMKGGRMRHQRISKDEREEKKCTFPNHDKYVTQNIDWSPKKSQPTIKSTQSVYEVTNSVHNLQDITIPTQTSYKETKTEKPSPQYKPKTLHPVHKPTHPVQKTPQPEQIAQQHIEMTIPLVKMPTHPVKKQSLRTQKQSVSKLHDEIEKSVKDAPFTYDGACSSQNAHNEQYCMDTVHLEKAMTKILQQPDSSLKPSTSQKKKMNRACDPYRLRNSQQKNIGQRKPSGALKTHHTAQLEQLQHTLKLRPPKQSTSALASFTQQSPQSVLYQEHSTTLLLSKQHAVKPSQPTEHITKPAQPKQHTHHTPDRVEPVQQNIILGPVQEKRHSPKPTYKAIESVQPTQLETQLPHPAHHSQRPKQPSQYALRSLCVHTMQHTPYQSQSTQHVPKATQSNQYVSKSAKPTQYVLNPRQLSQLAPMRGQLTQHVSKAEELTQYRRKYTKSNERGGHLQENLLNPMKEKVKSKPKPLQSTETTTISKKHKHEKQTKYSRKLQIQNEVTYPEPCNANENLTLTAHKPRDSQGSRTHYKTLQTHHATHPHHSKEQPPTCQVKLNITNKTEDTQKQITDPHHSTASATIHLANKIESNTYTCSYAPDKDDRGQETSLKKTLTQCTHTNESNLMPPGQDINEIPLHRSMKKHSRHRRRRTQSGKTCKPVRETKKIEKAFQLHSSITQSTYGHYSEGKRTEYKNTVGREELGDTKDHAIETNSRITDQKDKSTETNVQTPQHLETDKSGKTTESIKPPQPKKMIHPPKNDLGHVEKQGQHIRTSKFTEQTIKFHEPKKTITQIPMNISKSLDGETQSTGSMKTSKALESILQERQSSTKLYESEGKTQTRNKRLKSEKSITHATKPTPKDCKMSEVKRLVSSPKKQKFRDKLVKPLDRECVLIQKNIVLKEEPTESTGLKKMIKPDERQRDLRENLAEDSKNTATVLTKPKHDLTKHKVREEHRETYKGRRHKREKAMQAGTKKPKRVEKSNDLKYRKNGSKMEMRQIMVAADRKKKIVMEMQSTQMINAVISRKTDNILDTTKGAVYTQSEEKRLQTSKSSNSIDAKVEIPQNFPLATETKVLIPQDKVLLKHLVKSKLEACEQTKYDREVKQPSKTLTTMTSKEKRSLGETRDVLKTMKVDGQLFNRFPDMVKSCKTLPKHEVLKVLLDKATEVKEKIKSHERKKSNMEYSLEKSRSPVTSTPEKVTHHQTTKDIKAETRAFPIIMTPHATFKESCSSEHSPVTPLESHIFYKHKESHMSRTQYFNEHSNTDVNKNQGSAFLGQNDYLRSLNKCYKGDKPSRTINTGNLTASEINANGDQLPEDKVALVLPPYSQFHQKGYKDYIMELSWLYLYKYFGQRKRLKQMFSRYEINQHQQFKQVNKLLQKTNRPVNSNELIYRAKTLIQLKKIQETTLTAVVQQEKENNQRHEALTKQLQNVNTERRRLLSEREKLQKEINLTRKERFNHDARKCYQKFMATQRQVHKGEYLERYQHNLSLKLRKANEAIESNLKTLHSLKRKYNDVIFKKKKINRITKKISRKVKGIKRKLHKLQCLHNNVHIKSQTTHRIKRLRGLAENLHLQTERLKILKNVLQKVPKEKRYHIPTLIEALTDENKKIISWSVTDQSQYQGPRKKRLDGSEKYHLVASDVWMVSSSMPKDKPWKTSTEPWFVEPLDTVPRYVVIRVSRQETWTVTDIRTH